GEEGAGAEMPLQFPLRNRDRLRLRATAIDDARDKALLAHAECRSLTPSGARFGLKLLRLTHGINPWFPAISAGGRRFKARKAQAFSGTARRLQPRRSPSKQLPLEADH